MKLGSSVTSVAAACGVACSFFGGYVLWKDWRQRTDPTINWPKSLDGKVYLVTGANTGIGKSIASDLAFRKAKVYMLCRDMGKCETARKDIVLSSKNRYVYCRKCDLASQASIREFVEAFKQKESKVHGLFNNAGVYYAPRSHSEDGVEIHFAVNHLGHFLLTHLLLDLIKASSPSSIVVLMNPDYRKGKVNLEDPSFQRRPYCKAEAFNQSQMANMLMVESLSKDFLKDTGVTVNAAYPGICKTEIKRHLGVDKSLSATLVSKPLMSPLTRTADAGAKVAIHLALEPSLRGSGKFFSNFKELTVNDSVDLATARKLYAIDAYWTGLKSKEELAKIMVKS